MKRLTAVFAILLLLPVVSGQEVIKALRHNVSSASTITYVNSACTYQNSGATSITISYSPTAGDQVFVSAAVRNTSSTSYTTVTGVVDSASTALSHPSGSPSFPAEQIISTNAVTQDMYYTMSAGSGITSYTANFSSTYTISTSAICVAEYHGVAEIGNQNTMLSSSSTSSYSIAVTTHDTNNWVVAFFAPNGVESSPVCTATSGQGTVRAVTLGSGLTTFAMCVQDITEASPGSATLSGKLSSSHTYEAVAVELRTL